MPRIERRNVEDPGSKDIEIMVGLLGLMRPSGFPICNKSNYKLCLIKNSKIN